MPGGNLIRIPNRVLINSLSSGDVALSGNNLRVKQYGNTIDLSKVSNFTKVENAAGTLKVSTFEIKPVYPSDAATNGYEGGIVVERAWGFSGNPQDLYGHSKYYGTWLKNLGTAVSGYLALADRLSIANEIVEQAQSDAGAVATIKLYVVLAYTASGSVTVTDLNGTQLYSASGDQAAIVAGLGAVSGITVTSGSGVITVEASEGLLFTLEASKWALSSIHVKLTQKVAKYPFTVVAKNGSGTETVVTAFAREVLPISEIQQLFPYRPDWAFSTPHVPTAGTAYTKCIFIVDHADAAGLTGASRKESFEEVVEFYLPTSYAQNTLWADIFYPKLAELGLATFTLGATTLTLTGASGSGAGTMSVVDVPGFTVSSVKYYKNGTGTINLSTGVVASGTDADVFYAEIKYAHLDYLIVSKITCTTIATGSWTGAALTATEVLSYEFLGRWDLVTNGSGIGTPVLRNFGVEIVQQSWYCDSGDTCVVNALTGLITTAGANTDVMHGEVLYAGKTATTHFKHTWTTGNINNQTIVSVAG